MPKAPDDPLGDLGARRELPSGLFNGMIAPLIPYAIKGVIWYQGENNGGAGVEYRTLFGRLITDWREKWGEGDFPFLYVQIASYDCGTVPPSWPFLREAQLKTLALPNTGMATAIDLGDYKNVKEIHPPDKFDVATRLALVAKHVAYGQDLVYSGPVYDSFKVEGNAIRVNFTQTGGGLVMGTPPWINPAAPPWPTDKLTGFEIAGADGKYVPADARIDGNSVVVQSALKSHSRFMSATRGRMWSLPISTTKRDCPPCPFGTDNFPPGS